MEPHVILLFPLCQHFIYEFLLLGSTYFCVMNHNYYFQLLVSCGIFSAILDHRELDYSNIAFHVNMKFNFIFLPVANHLKGDCR